MQTNGKAKMYTETRDGKVYIVFQSGNNHICGQVAVGHQAALGRISNNMMPEELLEYFLEHGFVGM